MSQISNGLPVSSAGSQNIDRNAPAPKQEVEKMIKFLEKKGAQISPSQETIVQKDRVKDFNRYAQDGHITRDSYVNKRIIELRDLSYQSAMNLLTKSHSTGSPVKVADIEFAEFYIREAENKAALRNDAEEEFLKLLAKKDTITKDGKIDLKEYLQD
jgi:hypothetical protein